MARTIVTRSPWKRRMTTIGHAAAVTIMATTLVTALHIYGNRAPGVATHPVKAADRLAWEVEDLPVRKTAGFDNVAMFGLPFVEPQAWVDEALRPPATAAAAIPAAAPTATPLRMARAEPERKVATLPPSRPRAPDVAPLLITAATALPSEGGDRRRVELFGLGLPGTEYLPTPHEAARKVASVGEALVSVGEAVGDLVRPR